MRDEMKIENNEGLQLLYACFQWNGTSWKVDSTLKEMKSWEGNGKPPSVSLAKQPRTCLQAEDTINQLNQTFSLFFSFFFLLTIVIFSNSQLPWWCAILVWIACLHFCFSCFFFHFLNFSIPMCLFYLHGLSTSNEAISVNLHQALHFTLPQFL